MTCETCPFAFTDESEYVQNLGCLPTPREIMDMKSKSGHTWGCHSDECGKTKCQGFINYAKKEEEFSGKIFNFSTGGIIKYETWYYEGEEAALKEAEQNG